MHGITEFNGMNMALRATGTKVSWHAKETESDEPTKDAIGWVRFTEEATYTTSGILTPSRALIANVERNGFSGQVLTGMVGKNYKIQSLDVLQRRSDMLQEAGLKPNYAAWLHDFGALMLTFEVGRFNVVGLNKKYFDEHITYLSLLARFDYKGNDLLLVSGVRTLCQNTMWMAEAIAAEMQTMFKLRHTGDIDGKAERATSTLLGMDKDLGVAYASAVNQQAHYEALFNQLATQEVDDAYNLAFSKLVFSERKTGKPEEFTSGAIRNQDAFIEGMNNEEQTRFGVLNAITDMNKRLPVRMVGGMTEANRVGAQVTNDLFGTGADIRAKAMAILCA